MAKRFSFTFMKRRSKKPSPRPGNPDIYTARGPFAKYVIVKWPDTKYFLEEYPKGGGYIELGWFNTLDKAKDAAVSSEIGKLD